MFTLCDILLLILTHVVKVMIMNNLQKVLGGGHLNFVQKLLTNKVKKIMSYFYYIKNIYDIKNYSISFLSRDVRLSTQRDESIPPPPYLGLQLSTRETRLFHLSLTKGQPTFS